MNTLFFTAFLAAMSTGIPIAISSQLRPPTSHPAWPSLP